MYCTQQMILGENFRNWLKTAKVFPLESFAVYGSVKFSRVKIFVWPYKFWFFTGTFAKP